MALYDPKYVIDTMVKVMGLGGAGLCFAWLIMNAWVKLLHQKLGYAELPLAYLVLYSILVFALAPFAIIGVVLLKFFMG